MLSSPPAWTGDTPSTPPSVSLLLRAPQLQPASVQWAPLLSVQDAASISVAETPEKVLEFKTRPPVRVPDSFGFSPTQLERTINRADGALAHAKALKRAAHDDKLFLSDDVLVEMAARFDGVPRFLLDSGGVGMKRPLDVANVRFVPRALKFRRTDDGTVCSGWLSDAQLRDMWLP